MLGVEERWLDPDIKVFSDYSSRGGEKKKNPTASRRAVR